MKISSHFHWKSILNIERFRFLLLLPPMNITSNKVGKGNIGEYIKENLDHLYLYFPLIVYFAFLLQLGIRAFKEEYFIKSKECWMNSGILLLGLLFYSKVIVRSLYLHLMPTYAIAILVFLLVFKSN